MPQREPPSANLVSLSCEDTPARSEPYQVASAETTDGALSASEKTHFQASDPADCSTSSQQPQLLNHTRDFSMNPLNPDNCSWFHELTAFALGFSCMGRLDTRQMRS